MKLLYKPQADGLQRLLRPLVKPVHCSAAQESWETAHTNTQGVAYRRHAQHHLHPHTQNTYTICTLHFKLDKSLDLFFHYMEQDLEILMDTVFKEPPAILCSVQHARFTDFPLHCLHYIVHLLIGQQLSDLACNSTQQQKIIIIISFLHYLIPNSDLYC